MAALIDLELEPRAARGDELGLVDAHAVVHLGGEVHAGRADELRDDDALGAVDDEGAALRHEREVAHEDELLLDLAGLLVDEADVNEEGRLVGDVLGTALRDGVRGVAELVVTEGDLQGVRGVLDRGELGEGLGKALSHEALERLLLHGDQVRQLHRGSNLAKGLASGRSLWFRKSSLCGRHQAFPPSKRVEGGNCRNVISYRNSCPRSMKSLDLTRVFEYESTTRFLPAQIRRREVRACGGSVVSPWRTSVAALPLADKDMLASRTSRHLSGGRPHFSAAPIECGPAGTRCPHSTPGAEKGRALGPATRRNRPHFSPALGARTPCEKRGRTRGPDPLKVRCARNPK